MKKPTKKQMQKWMKKQEELAKEFKLTVRDLHNLYDLFYMITWQDYKTLKLNKMNKWFEDLFTRLEDICLDEEDSSNIRKAKVSK